MKNPAGLVIPSEWFLGPPDQLFHIQFVLEMWSVAQQRTRSSERTIVSEYLVSTMLCDLCRCLYTHFYHQTVSGKGEGINSYLNIPTRHRSRELKGATPNAAELHY